MTMKSRASLNKSLLYIGLITFIILANACGDAADSPYLEVDENSTNLGGDVQSPGIANYGDNTPISSGKYSTDDLIEREKAAKEETQTTPHRLPATHRPRAPRRRRPIR